MGAGLWTRWTLVVSAAEAAGFVVPAVVGGATAGLAAARAWPALLVAGAVEGAVLGWAQGSVLRRELPRLDVRRWTGLTAGAAVAAYALGGAASWLGSLEPPALGIPLAALAGLVLLLTLGAAQWLELRRHVDHSGRWVPWTAAGWLVALASFLAVATPLWHEGQPLAASFAVGVLAGCLMAFVQAAVTGLGLVRLLRTRPSLAAHSADRGRALAVRGGRARP